MDRDRMLRDHVLYVLRDGGAHLKFDKAVARLPAKLQGAKPAGMTHSPWRLIEHMRLAQWDILDFCRNPNYVAPKFPEGYWPKDDAPPNAKAWDGSIKAFKKDLKAMEVIQRAAAKLQSL